MAKKKVTRKQLLKEPDEFITISARIIRWIDQNRDRIVWGVAAAVFSAAAFSGWIYYKRVQNRQSVAAFGEVMAAYRLAEKDPNASQDRARVKEMLRSFVEKFPDTGSGKMGRVLLANLLYRTGDLDAAIAAYQHAIEDFGGQPLLKNVILSGLGHAYLKKQDSGQAVRCFEQIASGDEPLLKDEALFILAHLSDPASGTEAKSEKLNRILSEFPDSLFMELAKEEVSGLKK